MICKSCRKKVDDNSIYCRYCGERLIEPQRDKQHYRRILVSFAASMMACVGCLLPISKLGLIVYVIVIVSSLISMGFFLNAYRIAQHIYRKNEKYKGEALLKASLAISVICLLSTIFTLTNY